jgi:hypothetical protein
MSARVVLLYARIYATHCRYVGTDLPGLGMVLFLERSRSELVTGADDVAQFLDVR